MNAFSTLTFMHKKDADIYKNNFSYSNIDSVH